MAETRWWVDGAHLTALRDVRELSGMRLARLSGVGQRTLSRMERSTADQPYQPWPPNVAAVARALAVPAEALIGGDTAAFLADLERQPPKA